MKNLKFGLALLGSILLSAINPTVSVAQIDSTPTLNSINLPFRIDGEVERQYASSGDWTKGGQAQTGAVLTNAGDVANGLPLTYHIVDDWDATTDEVFTTGSKWDQDPTTWAWTNSKAPSKNDINNANIHISLDGNDSLWAIMSGDRLSTTGTSYIDFEFYQKELTANAPVGNANGSFTSAGNDCGRTEGDILVTVEYSNGGAVDSIYFYQWEADVNSSCGFAWHSFVLSNPHQAFGYSSTATAAVPYGAFGSNHYVQLQFVETAINFTAVIDAAIGNSNTPCTGAYFSTVFVKTKASNSPTAALKDMVMPIQLELFVAEAKLDYGDVCRGDVITPVNVGAPQLTINSFSIDPASSGISIDASTGEITVGNTASGSYKIYYSYSPRANCSKNDSLMIQVNEDIRGTVFHDDNGICAVDQVDDGTGMGTAGGSQLYAVLINSDDEVVESVAIDNGTGDYEFTCLPWATYSVVIKTSQPAVGSTGVTADAPGIWEFVGEKVGAGVGTDGNPNGTLTGIVINAASVENVDFGMEQRPEAVSTNNQIDVPDTTFTYVVGDALGLGTLDDLAGNDAEDGSPFSLVNGTISITSLPDSGYLYYNGVKITSVPHVIDNFDAGLLEYEVKCHFCQDFVFEYTVYDAACLEDLTPAQYRYWWVGNPVPVRFVDISARSIDATTNAISWSTASEVNNELFTIERKMEGEGDFNAVGELPGAGMSNEIKYYNFVDMNVPAGIRAYYRVKQTDYNGEFDYSDIVMVDMQLPMEVVVYPNPSNGAFVVQVADNSEFNAELYDLRGNLINTWNGIGKCDAQTDGLQPGLYNMKVTTINGSKNLLLQID